ncbi:hypothetical protein LuPra_03174 [Luteitalea pratensis]|uniref:Uncharacterized protein n=1 Tax=Luteitalea pratensis TaxID=1855912 RepID=A0A143PMU6_LUTPR|nr:hypothetical protein LuPra_03174 [Luteitalea pratensis]
MRLTVPVSIREARTTSGVAGLVAWIDEQTRREGGAFCCWPMTPPPRWARRWPYPTPATDRSPLAWAAAYEMQASTAEVDDARPWECVRAADSVVWHPAIDEARFAGDIAYRSCLRHES